VINLDFRAWGLVLLLPGFLCCGLEHAEAQAKAEHSTSAGHESAEHRKPTANDTLPVGYGSVALTADRVQRFGIRTEKVTRLALTREVRTVALVKPDETRESHVHVKWNGWIQDLFVNYLGQVVKKGDPLFSVYSPELVAAQQELLIAVRRLAGVKAAGNTPERQSAENLLDTARTKLRLWDVPPDAVAEIEKQGKLRHVITVRAPRTGTVITKKALPGMYVDPNMDLYTVTDLTKVWVIADLYEFEIPYIAKGQKATFTPVGAFAEQREMNASVAFIDPTVNPETRTVKVRLEASNPDGRLRPGAFGVLRLKLPLRETMVIGTNAVIYAGEQELVFIRVGDGLFEPRPIRVGIRAKDRIQVLEGLKEGDEVVTRGQFMLDSESRLRVEGTGPSHSKGH
jgi:membrane fusion protein, copper/silver efflux system